ncbi:hypothetical protein DM02DRAFT_676715 [Periconia macrospinosa]|uniref:DUF7580 domain-containing protein n=1 Tax=Periconia macrospinosa TaxID=97972 RepID=A0A2V1D6G3_9PLEO|nr:hypothetical protein DM02DRAFT_676715 [Periconia macrospinosa]
MADLVGVAGLTFAAFDRIWLIGSKTAEVISDYREFDKDSIELSNDITCENNRTKTLQCLLFEPSTAYSGRSLFEQFDENVQMQIQIRLEKLLNIINEGSELLNRQQIEQPMAQSEQVADGHEKINSENLAPTRISPLIKKKSRSLLRLRWSLWDKRRLESIVKDFAKENEKVNAQVQLMCHATSIGVNLTHLDRLKTNEHSRKLGFDLPAQLQLNITGMQTSPTSLQLKDERLFRDLTACSKIESKFAILDYLERPLLVEFRSYAPEKTEPVPLEDRTKDRVEMLAHLLLQRKDSVFHTLSCEGWVLDAQENQVAFLFAIPDGMKGMPFSLLRLYELQALRPSLGERLRLAKSLACSICELQLVKWVHKSFRSENILFFPRAQGAQEASIEKDRVGISQPWVMGFEFSRPELDFSSGRPDKDIARDVYRHPERQQRPQRPFSKIHDIYGLGVVLLEIGLWRPVLSLERDGFRRVNDPFTIQSYLVKKAEKSLPLQVGEHYKQVVVRCLTGRFDVENDNREELKLQQAFRAQVLDVLDRAAESIG